MNHLFLAFLFLTTLSGYTQDRLQEQSLLTKHFSSEQIDDLETILVFFESRICDNPKQTVECYQEFSNKLLDASNQNELFTPVEFNDLGKLYKKLRLPTHKSIWCYF